MDAFQSTATASLGVSTTDATTTSRHGIIHRGTLANVATSVELFGLASDLLEHLLSLEEFQDHDLSLTLIKVNLALCKFLLISRIISLLLGNLPSTEASHQLRVVIHLVQLNSATSLEESTKLLLHILLSLGSFLSLKLFFKLASLFSLLLPACKFLLHQVLLTLLLNHVGTVKGQKLLVNVLEKLTLLVTSQALVFVALLDLLLTFLDTLTKLGSICVHLLLHLLLASEHFIEIAVLVLQVVLELVLHSLLLKLDVAQTAFLLLLFLSLVLIKRLLVSSRLAIGKSLVTEKLHAHLALLGGHLSTEVHLLSSVLLL